VVDNATALTTNFSTDALGEVFGERFINRGLCPRTPDLKPCDYLWGHKKDRVWVKNPHSLQDSIRTGPASTSKQISRVSRNIFRRYVDRLQVGGRHIETRLWNTVSWTEGEKRILNSQRTHALYAIKPLWKLTCSATWWMGYCVLITTDGNCPRKRYTLQCTPDVSEAGLSLFSNGGCQYNNIFYGYLNITVYRWHKTWDIFNNGLEFQPINCGSRAGNDKSPEDGSSNQPKTSRTLNMPNTTDNSWHSNSNGNSNNNNNNNNNNNGSTTATNH